MLYSIKDREDLEYINELVSLESQIKAVRLQGKLGKQNFHEDMKKVLEAVTKSFKDVSEELTKTMTETSIKNNKELENLNDELSKLMNDSALLAFSLMSPLSKVTTPENTSHFKLVKDPNSNRVNDLLLHNTIPVTLYNNLLTFRDTGKKFELQGGLLKLITNKDYNIDVAILSDKKLMYDFAKKSFST